MTRSFPSWIDKSGHRWFVATNSSISPVRFTGLLPSALDRYISQSPSRLLAKAMRHPSGDQAGSMSSASSLVRFTGGPEGSCWSSILNAYMSVLPSLFETKATLSPSALTVGE